MQHTSEVWYCAWSAHAWLGLKFFGTFTRIVVKVYNLCRVKTNRLAVLTVKSGLNPHMINKLKDGYKSLSGYILWPCWVPTISVLTLAYCCSEKKGLEVFWRWCWVLGVRNPQSIAYEIWSLRLQDKLYNSDNLLFVVILFYVILLLIIHLWCLYMYETWSWHTYSYAFGFLLKTGCDRSGIRAVSTVGRKPR